jgi:ubiquinone/menaquinone biosynthesis C-methylase UbiE
MQTKSSPAMVPASSLLIKNFAKIRASLTVADRTSYPLFSRLHPLFTRMREGRGDQENRARLVAGLSGRVIEVGVGIGANFKYYPQTVEEVVAIEPGRWLRERAERAAAEASIPIKVIDGDADHLPSEVGSFDAGVVSLTLCTVPDPQQAITELFRVIRPGGEFRFFEHVIAEKPSAVRLQRLADATIWPHVAGGCHLARDTRASIEAGGFRIEECRRFPVSLTFFMPRDPHLLGVARRP